LRRSYAIGGVDLSLTTDLTGVVFYIKKDNRKYLISYLFMPSETLKQRNEENYVPYGI